MNDWIDIRDDVPDDGDRCLVVTKERSVVATRYVEGPLVVPGFWIDEEGYIDGVTHWKLRPKLPPMPKLKGPFKLIDSSTGPVILYGNRTYGLTWTIGETRHGLVDWLNEMWTKDKLAG